MLKYLCLLAILLSVSCATKNGGSTSSPAESVDAKAPSQECADAEHAAKPHRDQSEVQKHQLGDTVILQYQSFYISELAPEALAEFIKQNSIQLLIDFRSDGSDKNLTSEFPAVYWSHPLEDGAQFNQKNIGELMDHLSVFAGKKILFVSKDLDIAIVSFAQFYALEHSLNQNWIQKICTEMGLKDPAWISKWEQAARPKAVKRKAASKL